MFPLCSTIRNNLQLACLYIGLFELVLCVGRFGIFIDHLSTYRKSMTFTILSVPILVFTQEIIFFLQLLSAVMITVGSDQRSIGFLTIFLLLSITCVLLFMPVGVVCGVYGNNHILFTLSVLMAPEFYFWIIVIYYMQQLRSGNSSSADPEERATDV